MTDRVLTINSVSPQLIFAAEAPTLLDYVEALGELVLAPADDLNIHVMNVEGVQLHCRTNIVGPKSSIPTNRHIFRAGNLNTILFATDRFVTAVQDLGPVGLLFKSGEAF